MTLFRGTIKILLALLIVLSAVVSAGTFTCSAETTSDSAAEAGRVAETTSGSAAEAGRVAETTSDSAAEAENSDETAPDAVEEIFSPDDSGEYLSDDDIMALEEGFTSAVGIASEPHALTGIGVYKGLDEVFDSAEGIYVQSAADGRIFYTNVPNGSVVDFPVEFRFPNPFPETLVTRNDEPYDYLTDTPITESGAYSMKFTTDFVGITLSDQMSPHFNFRIVREPVNDMDIYNAPMGYAIAGAALDGKALTVRNNTALILDRDGKYEIELRAASEEYADAPKQTMVIARDTKPPEFHLVGVENGVANGSEVTVEYSPEDVDRVQMFLDSVEISFTGYPIIDPGHYRLLFYDSAGNSASGEFDIPFKMNAASVMLVVGVVLLFVLCVAGVLLRGRRDLRTR